MADFARLSCVQLEAMAASGVEVLDSQRALAVAGSSPLAAALQHATTVYEWQHYPAGDIYDPDSHAQYFYHAHPPYERRGGAPAGAQEHGHFHTFMREGGMPLGVSPLMMPELAIADNPAAPKAPLIASAPQIIVGEETDVWCHLVAIAMDSQGRPLRFFTTNRWVTSETWYPAVDVARMLDRFTLGSVPPAPDLNRWVAAMIGLYKPMLADLVARRDAAVMDWRRRRRAKVHVFEDRRLEVISSLEIDMERQIAAVAAALRRVA